MALIKCSECGKEVSEKAKSCPNCGNPINVDKTVKIEFPKASRQLFNTGCEVLVNDDLCIAKCKQGEVAEFLLTAPAMIKVKMHGWFGTPEIMAEPGGRYRVNIRPMGSIAISKVDII